MFATWLLYVWSNHLSIEDLAYTTHQIYISKWMIILLLLLIGTLKIIGKNIRHLVFKAPCHGNEKKKRVLCSGVRKGERTLVIPRTRLWKAFIRIEFQFGSKEFSPVGRFAFRYKIYSSMVSYYSIYRYTNLETLIEDLLWKRKSNWACTTHFKSMVTNKSSWANCQLPTN